MPSSWRSHENAATGKVDDLIDDTGCLLTGNTKWKREQGIIYYKYRVAFGLEMVISSDLTEWEQINVAHKSLMFMQLLHSDGCKLAAMDMRLTSL